MADMLEKIGVAARKEAARYSLSAQSGFPNAQVSLDGKLVFSGPIAECHALISNAVGRAAVEALREPTEDQKRIARQYFGLNPFDKNGGPMDHIFLTAYRAMIDAILKEEGNG